jgi:flavin reductase (DIM6/NTAB) family NADH-FMN oxidoreductase RutF
MGGTMKASLGVVNCLYPLPTVLVGANVNGKPNYITIANLGNGGPTSVCINMGKANYSYAGIKENGTFSINFPSVDMVRETDYCGLVSGQKVDKSQLFKNFYGKLETAPMIEECAINMECKLVQTVEFDRFDILIGEVVETYCDDKYLTEGIVDFAKVNPILFAISDKSYWKLGDRFAKAWNVGKELKT